MPVYFPAAALGKQQLWRRLIVNKLLSAKEILRAGRLAEVYFTYYDNRRLFNRVVCWAANTYRSR